MQPIFRLCYLIFLVVGCSKAFYRTDYCSYEVCGYENRHTMCKYYEGPGPLCRDYEHRPLSQDEKNLILRRLNKRRKGAAVGKLIYLRTVANMMKLHWAEDLAAMAQRWADQCRPPSLPEQKDECRDLSSITVGQAVLSVVGDAPGLRVETLVDIWYMQNLYYKGNESAFIRSPQNSSYYGDFGQMIWSSTYLVGCGRSQFTAKVRGRQQAVYRLVCNFAPRGPEHLQPLWIPGPPASRCPPNSLVDPETMVLCDFQFHNEENIYNLKKNLGIKDKIIKSDDNQIEVTRSSKRNKKSVRKSLFGLDGPKTYEIEELIDPLTFRIDLSMSEDGAFKGDHYDSYETSDKSNFTMKQSEDLDKDSFKNLIITSYVVDDSDTEAALVNEESTTNTKLSSFEETSLSNDATESTAITTKSTLSLNFTEESYQAPVEEINPNDESHVTNITNITESNKSAVTVSEDMHVEAQSKINITTKQSDNENKALNGSVAKITTKKSVDPIFIPDGNYDYLGEDISNKKNKRSLASMVMSIFKAPMEKLKARMNLRRNLNFTNKTTMLSPTLILVLSFLLFF